MELIEEDKQRGIIDKEVILDASYNEYVTYPKCGMSKVALKAINENKKRVDYYEFNKYNLSDRQTDRQTDRGWYCSFCVGI